jgi:hypothetical protein
VEAVSGVLGATADRHQSYSTSAVSLPTTKAMKDL